MDVQIRQAMFGDEAALADLGTQLGYASQADQVVHRLAQLPSGGHRVLVAVVERAVVGWIHVSRMPTLLLDDSAEILGFVVDQHWRGQGIGSTLLRAAEKWAISEGCPMMWVRANIVRQRAHEFYFQNGFRHVKTSLTLVKEL
jgi:GNAT superfamily N-acetyltransferase